MSSSTYQEEQKWIPRLARRTNDQRFTALPFLSFEYLKSMVATALAAFACHSRTRRRQAVRGDELADNPFRDLKILCVGMGGGTLPLFLAHHFPSCVLKVIEIDPKVSEPRACLAPISPIFSIPGLIFRGCLGAGSAYGRKLYGISNTRQRHKRQPITKDERFTWY